jgi:YidC/Oxa1 family membrane protein insertase
MMKLQQEEGFNPIAGCLPMLLQIPIFISLFHVLRHLANSVHLQPGDAKLTLYSFTSSETLSGAKAHLFGAPLAASLRDNAHKVHDLLGGDVSSTRVVTIVLVLVSSAATYFTQVLVRRGQTTVPEGTAATIQKVMLYFIPLSVLFSGLIFPLGVLLYWFTSNMWTLGQQAYINKFHPHTEAETGPVGELGKKLAPKPGQKPVRPQKAVRPDRTINVTPSEVVDDAVSDNGNSTTTRGGSPPKPGARPNRGSPNNRSGGKRPSQAKKRR